MEPLPTPGNPQDRDLPCGRCGYNLRTLPIDANCPECGTPVARTARGNSLAAANPRWRTALATGLLLLAASLGGLVFLEVLWGQGLETLRLTRVTIGTIFTLGVAGVWLVTAREPDPLKPESLGSLRKTVRWLALILTAACVTAALVGVRKILFVPGGSTLRVVLLVGALLVCLQFLLLALHVAALVRRAGRPFLAILWRLTGCVGLLGGITCIDPTNLIPEPNGEQVGRLSTLAFTLIPVMTAILMAGLLTHSAWVVWRVGAKPHHVPA